MVKIQKVHIDYEVNPVGVDTMPQIGFEIVSDKRNVVQKTYHIQVSSTANFQEIVYDSGTVLSEQSNQIQIREDFLEKGRTYYVRVRITDEDEASIWSETATFTTALLGEPWQADFVSGETDDSYKEQSKGTYVRGQFSLRSKVKEAYAFTTALGLYNFYINGRKVSDDEMTPGWTSCNRNLLYQTYNVTDYLEEGENAAGAIVCAGWYRGMMGLTRAINNYGEKTCFSMELLVRYEDGTEEMIYTDKSWRCQDAPVVFADIYNGETYDSDLEIKDWATPRCDTNQFKNVEIVPQDVSILKAQSGGRVKVMERMPAKSLTITPKGEQVLDFGQNMAGRIKVRATGKKGDVIEIRCFEALDKNGNVYVENLRHARTTMKYIFSEDSTITYHPSFTFMGFRYAHIISYVEQLHIEDFEAEVLHSNMAPLGSVSCSNPLLNQLHHNYLWGLKGNFLDVPTDCPQRDERLGWTGDAQIFSKTASYLVNTYTFYKKWLVDLEADQTEDGGVPHVIPNIEEGRTGGNWLLKQGEHSAAAWADAAVIIPYNLYLMYGDEEILKRQYTSMKKWVEFMCQHSNDYIWNYKLQFGDWVALDADEGGFFGATPNDLTCTAYFAYTTKLFATIAKVLGNEEDNQKYSGIYKKIVHKFQQTFFDKNGVMTAQTQTAHIIALHFKLTPEAYIQKTIDGLKKLLDKENGHLVTGFVGTPYFCHALSDNGCLEEAYSLLQKEDYPSWLYQVKMGATTIWERWNGLKPDGTMSDPGMNSFNHYAYGAIGEWVYKVMFGLDATEEQPGFKHSIIYPKIGGGITFTEGTYHSFYGVHKIAWKIKGQQVEITVDIPANTTASIRLDQCKKVIESDGLTFKNQGAYYEAISGSGSYSISYVRR